FPYTTLFRSLAPDVLDRLRSPDARIGHEHVDGQGAVVGLGLTLVAALRELERSPGPHEHRIGAQVPLVLLRDLDAESLGGGAQEPQARFLRSPGHLLAGGR